MTLSSGEQIIAMYISHNISRSKSNQTIIFGQLVDYNMRIIFLEKSYTNLVDKLVSDLFLKNQNWAYLWIIILRFDTVTFIACSSRGSAKFIETSAVHLVLPHMKLFWKTKRGLELVCFASFLAWFSKKNSLHVLFY